MLARRRARAVIAVFERFTDRARRVVVLAQEEARMLNHNYIGTEHILLGLIHEGEGVAARALESLGVSLETVRLQVEEIIGQGQEAPSGHIPFTPRAKKVIELAGREAQDLGHNYIGTEHLLLGLIREGDGVAAQVLARLGVDLAAARLQVTGLLHGRAGSVLLSQRPRRGRRERDRLFDDALARIDALDRQLAAIERWIGMRPDLGDIDQQIVQVRRDKEAAIDTQRLRDRRHLARPGERTARSPGPPGEGMDRGYGGPPVGGRGIQPGARRAGAAAGRSARAGHRAG